MQAPAQPADDASQNPSAAATPPEASTGAAIGAAQQAQCALYRTSPSLLPMSFLYSTGLIQASVSPGATEQEAKEQITSAPGPLLRSYASQCAGSLVQVYITLIPGPSSATLEGPPALLSSPPDSLTDTTLTVAFDAVMLVGNQAPAPPMAEAARFPSPAAAAPPSLPPSTPEAPAAPALCIQEVMPTSHAQDSSSSGRAAAPSVSLPSEAVPAAQEEAGYLVVHPVSPGRAATESMQTLSIAISAAASFVSPQVASGKAGGCGFPGSGPGHCCGDPDPSDEDAPEPEAQVQTHQAGAREGVEPAPAPATAAAAAPAAAEAVVAEGRTRAGAAQPGVEVEGQAVPEAPPAAAVPAAPTPVPQPVPPTHGHAAVTPPPPPPPPPPLPPQQQLPAAASAQMPSAASLESHLMTGLASRAPGVRVLGCSVNLSGAWVATPGSTAPSRPIT